MVTATVREWHDDLGWGVVDSPETPGGCWVHFSHIESPVIANSDGVEISEYKELAPGETVALEWTTPGQDGWDFQAVVVRRSPGSASW
jgi:CspA family cold shock protein